MCCAVRAALSAARAARPDPPCSPGCGPSGPTPEGAATGGAPAVTSPVHLPDVHQGHQAPQATRSRNAPTVLPRLLCCACPDTLAHPPKVSGEQACVFAEEDAVRWLEEVRCLRYAVHAGYTLILNAG